MKKLLAFTLGMVLILACCASASAERAYINQTRIPAQAVNTVIVTDEYGVWKGVRHIQCKAIRKGLRNHSVRPPISFFRDVAGRSYLIVKPNDTPTFVGPK